MSANPSSGVSLARYSRLSLPKHTCKNPSEWRLLAGRPPERLSSYYHFACDFGTSVMGCLKADDRSEPIYVCEQHAAELGYAAAAGVKRAYPAKQSDDGLRERSRSPRTGATSAANLTPAATDTNVTAPAGQPADKGRRYGYVV